MRETRPEPAVDGPDQARRPREGLALVVRALRVAATLAGAALAVLFVWVTVARFLHPAADHEWMTGAVRDAVDRVRRGAPLYAAPSAEFIPFLYPPLYFWLAAALARVVGTFAGAKLVSLLATAATCAAIARIGHSLGAKRFWISASVLLYVGAYGPTLWFYDLERVDATAAAFVAGGVAVLLSRDRPWTPVVAGLLLGLSLFAKQAGVFVFAAAVVALVASGERRRALLVTASGAAVALVLGGWLHASTGGWFGYYCLKLPRAHGIDAHLVALYFLVDMPKMFVLSAASVGIVGWAGWRAARRDLPPWRETVLAGVLAAAMASAFFHRAHVGGWTNVLLAWTPLACAGVAVAASRAVDGPRSEALVLAAVTLQLLGWTFDPGEAAPGPQDDRNAARVETLVRRLEREGEVVLTTTGGVTRARHFHSAALFDVLRAGDPPPDDYVEAIRARRYAAMIVGVPNEAPCAERHCAPLHEAVMRNYFVAARLDDPPRSAMIGFDARPRWVLRPRRRAADAGAAALGYAQLEERERAEIALALERQLVGPRGDAAIPHDDIEELADALRSPVRAAP